MKKYNLKDDHTEIKKRIKEWELEIDRIISILFDFSQTGKWSNDMPSPMALSEELESISHEMMAINI